MKGSKAQAWETFIGVLGNGETGGRFALGQGHGQGCALEITLMLAVRQTGGDDRG